MRRYRAIVLRSYFPTKLKLSVLDEQLGHLEVVCRDKIVERVCHGSLISYQREKKANGLFIAQEIELLYIPFFMDQADLLFFHQLLELTQFFAPIEGCTPEVFVFLFSLYRKKIEGLIWQKMALCQLLYLLGVCPENASRDMVDLFSLISSSGDIMLSENTSEQAIEDLNKWLADSILLHPFAHKLKTITFMP